MFFDKYSYVSKKFCYSTVFVPSMNFNTRTLVIQHPPGGIVQAASDWLNCIILTEPFSLTGIGTSILGLLESIGMIE